MNEQDVESMLQEAIGSATTNKFGWDFGEKLVSPPRLIKVLDTAGNIWEVWLILDEVEDGSGYRIAYDPSDKSFGLISNELVVSEYSEFMEAINGM